MVYLTLVLNWPAVPFVLYCVPIITIPLLLNALPGAFTRIHWTHRWIAHASHVHRCSCYKTLTINSLNLVAQQSFDIGNRKSWHGLHLICMVCNIWERLRSLRSAIEMFALISHNVVVVFWCFSLSQRCSYTVADLENLNNHTWIFFLIHNFRYSCKAYGLRENLWELDVKGDSCNSLEGRAEALTFKCELWPFCIYSIG